MITKRNNILLTLLYVADEDIVSKELILYLDENVPRDKALTPDGLMSVCMMHWAVSPKRMPSDSQITQIRQTLTNALKFAWSHNWRYLDRVARLQRKRMRGWRISEAHRLRKIAKAFDVPVS